MARDLDARHDLDPAAVIVSACLRLGSGLPLRRGGGVSDIGADSIFALA
ncbi:hypothetical protein WOB59_08425 [Methylocystis sp. IM4]